MIGGILFIGGGSASEKTFLDSPSIIGFLVLTEYIFFLIKLKGEEYL